MYCLYTLAIWYCPMEVIPWEKENLGRKRLLFGLWHYTPLSSLFVRVQTDFGILSLVGGCRDGLVYCPGETR